MLMYMREDADVDGWRTERAVAPSYSPVTHVQLVRRNIKLIHARHQIHKWHADVRTDPCTHCVAMNFTCL